MRAIDRLVKYLQYKNLTGYKFEKAINVANGYLNKQVKGKGSVGSDIMEKIHVHFRDLSLSWLITGKGEMLMDDEALHLLQEQRIQYSKDEKIQLLSERIHLLETALGDKEKIILLLEGEVAKRRASE